MNRKSREARLRRRRYTLIRNTMIIVLVILLSSLAGLLIYQKNEANSAQQTKKEASVKKTTSKKVNTIKKVPKQTTESYINKDVQRGKNTATEENHKTNGLAICMYHYIYDKNNPPKEKLNNNYIEVHALEEELKYLTENNYYFPTWSEVRQYVDGELLLPKKASYFLLTTALTIFWILVSHCLKNIRYLSLLFNWHKRRREESEKVCQ